MSILLETCAMAMMRSGRFVRLLVMMSLMAGAGGDVS
jgi:hypothetical protein